jgi:hypothetical protein
MPSSMPSCAPDYAATLWNLVACRGKYGNACDTTQGAERFGKALIFIDKKVVPRGGIEPPTHGFSVRCSTN